MSKTIRQLARSLDKDEKEVLKAAQQLEGLNFVKVRDVNYQLTLSQCKQLEKTLCPTTAIENDDDDVTTAEEMTTDSLSIIPKDIQSTYDSLKFGEMNHGLWVHSEVLDAMQTHIELQKRIGIVLQHLAAHGRTSVVKGCTDETNSGWLRSPLGGNNGMQYYLWWTIQGSRPTKALDMPAHGIIIQAIRHHDDHAPLHVDELEHYFSFKQPEIEEEHLRPWTEEQLQFIEADDPIRLIMGHPGSGKTTVLWKAIESRSNQKVLYLTWSRDLTQSARKHFDTFAPSDVQIDARDFLSFLGEICGVDIKRMTLRESQKAFRRSISDLQPSFLGLWAHRKHALHAELRAFVIGRAIPEHKNCDSSAGFDRLNDAEYLRQRGSKSKSGIGHDAAETLLKILKTSQNKAQFEAIFPDLAAASQAIAKLRRDEIPDGFLEFDRIVVDEVQDLTLVEMAVITELCRAISRHRGHAPWLLIAGDDAQTVRPSGFEWGALSDLIARNVGTPQKFPLAENLRCPTKIANVIERASDYYSNLIKAKRPTNQQKISGGQHVEAHLFHVEIDSEDDAVEFLERVEDMKGVVILSTQDECPKWVPPLLQDMVLSPADAKGLEYQSVIILDSGKLLASLQQPEADAELEIHQLRTTIDQFRVAISRATETLVFLDVAASDTEKKLSLELLQDSAPYDVEDLAVHFTDTNISPEEQVLVRTKDARSLIDERPKRAWQRALQAMRLLGNSNLPNGVATESVRIEAYQMVLTTAAHLLIKGLPSGVNLQEVSDAAYKALENLDIQDGKAAFEQLLIWCSDRKSAPLALLDETLKLGEHGLWLREALEDVAQILRQTIIEGASQSVTAKIYAGDVSGWMALTGYAGDLKTESRKLRSTAVDTLIRAGDYEAAELVLTQVTPFDAMLTGRLREAQARYKDAADAFEQGELLDHALRNRRAACDWERAIRLAQDINADEHVKSDLKWLNDFQAIITNCPPKILSRITQNESERIRQLASSIQKNLNIKHKAHP